MTLVAATLRGPDDWNDHAALLNYSFSVLKRVKLLRAKPDIRVPVIGGVKDSIRCSFDAENLEASLREQEISRVRQHIQLRPFYYASVTEGQQLGEIVFTLDGVVLASRPIFAAESVEKTRPSRLKGLLRAIFP